MASICVVPVTGRHIIPNGHTKLIEHGEGVDIVQPEEYLARRLDEQLAVLCRDGDILARISGEERCEVCGRVGRYGDAGVARVVYLRIGEVGVLRPRPRTQYIDAAAAVDIGVEVYADKVVGTP